MLFLSDFYKSLFGCKVYKVSLDSRCTCPNRDGTKGTGGCIFCSQSGSGDFIANGASISEQYERGRLLVENKARGRGKKSKYLFLPYFQSFTPTYGNFNTIRNNFLDSLSLPDSCGLAVATRPDCIPENILELFKEIAGKHFLQIELGLQTSNDKTGNIINRCYDRKDYVDAVERIKDRIPSAHIVTHIIFGLPGERERDMIDTVRFVCETNADRCFGIKITNLYVIENTALAEMYRNNKYRCLEKDEYFCCLKKAFSSLPANAVVHRFTGDPPKRIAIAPLWALNKRAVLNEARNLFSEIESKP